MKRLFVATVFLALLCFCCQVVYSISISPSFPLSASTNQMSGSAAFDGTNYLFAIGAGDNFQSPLLVGAQLVSQSGALVL